MELVIGIILIVAALFLIIAVLMQHGKDHNLSGTIAGASESFFGKSKSTTLDKKLSVLTSVVAVVFVVLVLVMYLGQDRFNNNGAVPQTTESQSESVIATGEPTDTAEPANTEEPTDTEEPTGTEEPANTEEPTGTDESVDTADTGETQTDTAVGD